MTSAPGPSPLPGGEDREERLDAVLSEYLEAADAGRAPDPEAVIARHPDLAGALREFFRDL
jgi:hypothetical protein